VINMTDVVEPEGFPTTRFSGRWKNEVEGRPAPTPELDSKAVRVVPGQPEELDSAEVGHHEEAHL
jgi:hypothetical protein